MKIKKVEISAFRAFNKIEDATFDFTLPDNKIANFISIYAPNGYGKTSFYDAVEWCITGQIERFHKNASENNKLGIENRKGGKEKLSLLQHHNQKRLGSVTVLADNKKYTKKLTRSKVFDFKQKSKNVFFKDVILSQDLIDSFIKEDKAEERYKKFIDSIPHLQEYNNALQNVIKLIFIANEKRKELTKDKKSKEDTQLKIDFEGDVKILEEINFAISRLIERNQKIELIQKDSFSRNEYNFLSQKVNSEIASLGIEIEALKLGIGNIYMAYNGSDKDKNNKGIVEYYNLKDKSKAFNSKKNELIEILESIRKKEKLEKLIIDSKEDLKKVIKLNNTHLEIKSDFGKYSKIELEIQRLNKKVTNLGSEKEKAKIIEQELFTKENNTKSDLTKKQYEHAIIKNRLKDIPENKIKFEKINNEIIEVTKYIKKTEESLNENNTYRKNINLKSEQNSFFQNKLKEDVELLLDYDFFKEYRSLIMEVVELQRKQEILNKELIELNNEINIQGDLKKELSAFLSRGIELIAKNESTICPLCSQQYDSFVELSNKISNNKLLSSIQKNSLTKKSNLEIEYKNSNTIIGEKVKTLEDVITIAKASIELKLIKNYRVLKDLKDNVDKNKEVLSILETEKLSLTSFFGGVDTNAIEKRIKIELLDIEMIVKEFTTLLNKIKKDNNNNNSLILELDKEILFLTDEIEKEKKTNIYNKVRNYYYEILKSNTINLSSLEDEINKNDKIVLELKLKVEENTKSIKAIKKSLASNKLSNKEITEKLNFIDKVKLIGQKVIQNFEQFILTDYDIDLVGLTKIETDKAFESLKSIEKEKLSVKDDLLINYKIIERLKDDSYKFLESEKTKRIIEDLNKEIKIVKNIEKKIKKEKDNLEAYLKKSIDGFFYTDLINKIYQKIEPHPDYPEIEFDCDFKDKNPRLQIYSKDMGGDKSIPALYFSTAQINILSLSIFLARALKAKNKETGEDVKCIFIDDPIQSMDSINILSFIDLFRSIVVSLDRQLIVATHEENFHLLLQKKIPKQLFKSKFIEFETFGKLKK